MANTIQQWWIRAQHPQINSYLVLPEGIAYIPDTTNSAPGTTATAAGDTGGTWRGSGDSRGEGTGRVLLLLPMEVGDEKLRSDGLGGGTSGALRSRKVSGEMTCANRAVAGVYTTRGRGGRRERKGKMFYVLRTTNCGKPRKR